MKPVIIGARRWLVVSSLLLAGATFGGIAVHGWIVAPPKPVGPIADCQDMAVRLDHGTPWVKCDSRARLERVGGDGEGIVRCVCPRPESVPIAAPPLHIDGITGGGFLESTSDVLRFTP